MSSTTPFLLPITEHYDGSNWLNFKTKIRAAAKQRGTLAYLDGDIKCPPPPPDPIHSDDDADGDSDSKAHISEHRTTYWGSTKPTYEEWLQRDAWTQGLITLNVKNPVGLGIVMNGTAAETWASIARIKDEVTDLGCITAEQELNAIRYTEGSDMDDHIAKLRTAWAKANDQGADLDDRKFRMVVLRSLPASWLPFVGSLHGEETSASVISRIVAHARMIAVHHPVVPQTTRALSTQSQRLPKNPDIQCSNCDKIGHEFATCFQPGGGMAGQYPDWWRGRKGGRGKPMNVAASATTTVLPTAPQANLVVAATDTEAYYAFSSLSVPQNGMAEIVTYADSAASEHYFVNRADFTDYKPIKRAGEAANGSPFHILGTGTVRKVVVTGGKRVNITFSDALHVPDFSHNLISIGRLDSRGFSVRFGDGKATFFDPAGKLFMAGAAAGSMYRLDMRNPLPDDILPIAFASRSLTRATDLETWHRRLGHISEDTVRRMLRGEMVIGLTNETVTTTETRGRCEDCIFGKQTRRPFDYEVVPVKKVLGLVCIDLWGPAQTQSNGGKLLMMLFTDAMGKHRSVYFLAHKDMTSTYDSLKHFKAQAELQTGEKLMRIRTDNGREFVNELWEAFCAEHGIIHEFTTPYSSAANGIAERANRTVLDLARTLLHDGGLPGSFWAEAMATAVYVLNRVPPRDSLKTPHETWTGEKPDVSHMRPFGCVAYAKIPDDVNDGKLAPRSIKCRLLGYYGVGAYRLWDAASGRIFKSRDVIFEEGPAKRTTGIVVEDDVDSAVEGVADESVVGEGRNVDDGSVMEGEPVTALPPDDPAYGLVKSHTTFPTPATPEAPTIVQGGAILAVPRRSARIAGEAPEISKPGPLACATVDRESGPSSEFWVPRTASEALEKGGPEWKAAMDKEFAMMLKKGVWKLVERPKGAKTMKCKWVFANKLDGEGKVVAKKARIVAKGFTQIPGLHFFESYASVVRYESVRIMLSTAVCEGMVIWQGDYVSAYLNARNQVPIIMEQIDGYELRNLEGAIPSNTISVPRADGLVYELQTFIPPGGNILAWSEDVLSPDYKAPTAPTESEGELPPGTITSTDEKELAVVLYRGLYGTVDGGFNWAQALNEEMTKLGYYQSRADQSIRMRLVGKERTITATYTDDVTGASSTLEGSRLAVAELGRNYEIKDLGLAKHMIGMTLERDEEKGMLRIHQRPFIDRVLARFNMADAAPRYTPLPAGIVLSASMSPTSALDHALMAGKPYREALGCIMFLQNVSRPDLSFAVAVLSRFASNPGIEHWNALKHVLAYLKTTRHFNLTFGGEGHRSFKPIGYSDSDFASDPDKRRSCSGYIFMQGGGPSAWGSKFQQTVALSTSEAEYMALTRAAQQLEWMYSSLEEIGFPQPRPAILRADNQSAIFLARNVKHNARVKHIDVRAHYIRERVAAGDIDVEYVPSAENLADLFTKPLGRVAHWRLCAAMRLFDASLLPLGE